MTLKEEKDILEYFKEDSDKQKQQLEEMKKSQTKVRRT